MATPTALAGLQSIPLELIAPNPFNPRKHFEKGALQELADSIKVHGVRQPVLVRPAGKGFQLVVGERRWRASKLAGKADIPAIVDPNLDDRSALEIMVIENLQREDVHPLDEALGYQVLMEQRYAESCAKAEAVHEGATAESIAAKVGKSVGYVYARLKLLALVPAARQAFERDYLTAGHAVLIARLQPKDQIVAVDACFAYSLTSYRSDELRKLDPKTAKLEDIADFDVDGVNADLGAGHHPRLLAEKGLREWIQDNVNLRLKDVPWDLADAKLFPEAGPCTTCQKRSTSNPALFAELAVKGEDTCFDAACYGKKREAFVKITLAADKKRAQEASGATSFPPGEKEAPVERIRQISEQTAYTAPKPDQQILKQGQWLAAKKNECLATEEALIVNGANAGVRRLVCCNGACKVHKHHFLQPISRMSQPENGNDPTVRAAREAKQRIDAQVIQHVLAIAVAKITKPSAGALLEIADRMLDNFYGDLPTVARALGLKCETGNDDARKAIATFQKKADATGAMRLTWLMSAADDLVEWSPEFKAIAKRCKVDTAKLRKELEKKAAVPVQTSAKAKTAAKGK